MIRRTPTLSVVLLVVGLVLAGWTGAAGLRDQPAHAASETKNDHAHDDADGHDQGHEEHDDGEGVTIPAKVMAEFGITVEQASSGQLHQVVRLSGEVVYNADRVAHVSPAVAGVVQRVTVSVGDHVRAGQVLAVLRSRELAASRSEYLAAGARLALAEETLVARTKLYQGRIALAEETLKRDQRLFDEKVGTERQLLESQQALQEVRTSFELEAVDSRQRVTDARISLNQAENNLHALGYTHADVAAIKDLPDTQFNAYELLSPMGGVVTQRHLAIGEVVDAGVSDPPFVVADLSTVWVNLAVYQRDLAHVRAGQSVELQFGHGIADALGVLAFVSPALEEKTRTATARIVLTNPDGQWRPGLFVTAGIQAEAEAADLVVPRSALTELDGKTVLFVRHGKRFAPRSVQVGRTTDSYVEIVKGLHAGETYVSSGVLALKAEMNRAALEHAGHAH